MHKKIAIIFSIILICLIIVFYQFFDTPKAVNINVNVYPSIKAIMKNYEKLVDKKPTPFELIAFINGNIGFVDKENANIMVTDAISYNSEYSSENDFKELYQLLDKTYGINIYFEIDNINSLTNTNDEVREMMGKYLEAGYILKSAEANYWIELNYNFYYINYEEFVSEEIGDYLKIKADSNIISDGELKVSFDVLGQRIIGLEEYRTKYLESSFANIDEYMNEVDTYYKQYVEFYILGSPNTKPYDNVTKVIKSDVLTSYNYIKNNYKDYEIADTLTNYLAKLQVSKNVFNATIESEMTNLLK